MRPQLIRLTPEYNIKPFDCEDADLNGFLLETDHTIPNARHHAIELLAVTYLIEDLDSDETIAYFSLLNDKIERDITDTTAWNRLSRQLPNIKRRVLTLQSKLAVLPYPGNIKDRDGVNRYFLC